MAGGTTATLRMIFLAILLASCIPTLPAEEHNFRPAQGLVPDAKTAIAIAVAVWTPIYGEEQIISEKPYVATLSGDEWTVTGSLPKGWLGGVAIAVISKSDGRILRISHGR